MSEPAWKAANRAHWDEKVALHLGPRGYNLASLRAGQGRFNAIEEAELWPVAGSRILHLQCHFGSDSLKLAQRGATVVGLDFSAPAIDAARRLASELGLADRARFFVGDWAAAMASRFGRFSMQPSGSLACLRLCARTMGRPLPGRGRAGCRAWGFG